MAAKSGGRINFTKLGIAVIDELTEILRDILTQEVKPSLIAKKVKSSTTLPKLRLDQELLIKTAKTAGYANFDTTLLYTLLRNECPNISPPTNGWGKDPGSADITIGDDIERIRLIRNKVLGHISTASVPDSEFQSIWAEIEAICQRMEIHLGSTHNYVQNLKQLELKAVDEELETTYFEQLQSTIKNEKELAEMIQALSSKVEDVKSEVKDVKTDVKELKSNSGKHKLEADTKVDIEIGPDKKRKQGSGDNLLNMAYQTLDTIVRSITEESTVAEYLEVCTEVEECGRSIEDKERFHGFFEIMESFQAITNRFVQVQVDKTKRFSILSTFLRLVNNIRKYKGKLEVREGCFTLHMTFQHEEDLVQYQQDIQGGELEKLLAECLLFQPFLSIFDLNPTDVTIKLKDITDHADLPELTTDPQAQHYIECSNCDRNAEHFCNTCNDKFCSKCKNSHEIKHHDVVPYRQKMTTEYCRIHKDSVYRQCCQVCEVPVCQKCMDEKHEDHFFMEINNFFESKKDEYNYNITKIRDEFIPKSTFLLGDVQSDIVKCKKEIANMLSTMTTNAQVLKDIIDIVVAENTNYLKALEKSMISELQKQEKTINNHIIYLKNIVDEYDKYLLSKQHATFILAQKENSIKNVKEIPILPEINLPKFTDNEVKKEVITSMVGEIQEPQKPTSSRKIRNIHVRFINKSGTVMKPFPTATKMMSFTAPGVYYSLHISPVTADQAWISDYDGNLVLTDMKGNKLNEMEYADGRYGCHTTSDTGQLIFLNEGDDGIYKATENQMKPTRITKVPKAAVSSIYSSPSNGDILVGMIGRVIRYKKTGKEVHQIQNDNRGNPLYGYPHYITENQINGDVCVSDFYNCAVVVVDKDRNYRFSFTGYPQGSVLQPYGIGTDTLGHILVIDHKSRTVQMTDKDGHFLTFLLATEQGILRPTGLSLDVRNNRLCVGYYNNNTVSVYRYKPQ